MDLGYSFTGTDSLVRKLQRGGAIGEDELEKALEASTLKIKALAILSISRGSRTGRVYKQNKAGGQHQAAGPGEPPKTQSGLLVSQITQEKVSNKEYNVGSRSRAPHGAWQEFGTGGKNRMPAHPWLGPAVKASKQFIEGRMKTALKNVAKRMSHER